MVLDLDEGDAFVHSVFLAIKDQHSLDLVFAGWLGWDGQLQFLLPRDSTDGKVPVDIKSGRDILDCRWLAWDNRRYPSDEELDVGYNGYANLSLNGPALHIAYYDLNQALLLTEDWHIDVESGALDGPSLKKVLDDPSLHCREA